MKVEDSPESIPVFKNEHPIQPVEAGARVSWNQKHDSKLLSLVKQNNGKNWKFIALQMQEFFNDPELTAKKCRERWCNCTDPNLNRTSLTDNEELLLLFYHSIHDNKWSLMDQHLTNRHSSMVKINFSISLVMILR